MPEVPKNTPLVGSQRAARNMFRCYPLDAWLLSPSPSASTFPSYWIASYGITPNDITSQGIISSGVYNLRPAQGLGFRRNLEGGPAGWCRWSPMFPDLAHKISLQWSSVQAISQACPGSFETPELAMSISRDLGCVIVPSHSSMVASEPSRPGRASTMGRGKLPSSAPLLAYLHSTTTQIAVQGPAVTEQHMLRSLNAVTI